MGTLRAIPEAGAVFTGWSGGGCAGTDPCVVPLDADTTVTATFEPIEARFRLVSSTDGAER